MLLQITVHAWHVSSPIRMEAALFRWLGLQVARVTRAIVCNTPLVSVAGGILLLIDMLCWLAIDMAMSMAGSPQAILPRPFSLYSCCRGATKR